MAATFERRRFSVSDYAKMLESGILDEDDRVELIDGEVRRMSPIVSRHVAIVNRLTRLLVRMVGDTAIVSIQNPIPLNDYTEPQPDVTVVRWRSDFYEQLKAQPEDVLLLIEVADSSLQYDRQEKLPRYAAAGIPEVWIVDIDENRQVIEQYAAPQGGLYSIPQIHAVGEVIVSVSLPDVIRLPVAEVFG